MIVAHRGFHAVAPENTLAAFRAAVSLGADMVELDVQQTADGELVVRHDDFVGDLPIGQVSVADVLREHPETPLLADVLAELRDAIEFDVEVKFAGAANVAEVIRASQARCVLTSFDPTTLRELERAWPESRRGLLVRGEDGIPLLQDAAADASADFLALEVPLARPEVLELGRNLGPSFVWTVNDPGDMRRLLADPNVGGIVTDRLDMALRVREELRRSG